MVGSALRKIAKEHDMNVANGVAYGGFHGFAVTLFEGSGYKTMAITTKYENPADRDLLEEKLNKHNLRKEFRILNLDLMEDAIVVTFHDTIGTMKKFNAFVDFFFPLLAQTSAKGINYCMECGLEFSGNGTWKLVNGMACHVHEGCAARMQSQAEAEEQRMEEEDEGTYGKGFVGAMIGGLLGAIVWAIVLYIGYFAAIVGVLIGFLAYKGYEKAHGKHGKGKVAILLLVGLLSVVIGNFGSDVITIVTMISAGELEMAYGEIPYLIGIMLATDGEYLSATLMNLGLGYVFALLGMYGFLKKAHGETKGFRMKNLK